MPPRFSALHVTDSRLMNIEAFGENAMQFVGGAYLPDGLYR
jgi:hypothetical protein